jgi:hypothetical protein
MYRATIVRPDGEHVEVGLYSTRDEAIHAAARVRGPNDTTIVTEANRRGRRDREATTRHNAPALWDLLNPSRR